MRAGRLLASVLTDPASAASLDADAWKGMIAAARAEALLGTLAHRLDGVAMPRAAAAILADARRSAEQGRTRALWEAEMARRALAPLGVTVTLLKGTAFVAAGLDAGVGRSIGDLDILVPRADLDAVEGALLGAGWEWVKPDAYDDFYYRRWMHELPPLIHRTRDRMIDVHHTILPLTARRKPDAEALIAASEVLNEDGLRVLSPPDMIVHAAAHLLADGDLAGGLRNLWDIDRLVREFGPREGFWRGLEERCALHDLRRETARALRLSRRIYGTPVDSALAGRSRIADRLYTGRLMARDGWGRPTRPALRLAFYVRSHWLRMPPAKLARHLWIKVRRRPAGPVPRAAGA